MIKPKTAAKTEKKANDKVKEVLNKIASKGRDELKKAVKVQKVKEEAPKKTNQVKTNDKPETVHLKPEKAAVEKAVPKDEEEDDSEESGEESKVVVEKGNESNEEESIDDDSDDDSEVGIDFKSFLFECDVSNEETTNYFPFKMLLWGNV